MGYDTELFVEQPIHEDLICNVCHEVQQRSTIVCQNGHWFCAQCVLDWLARSKTCPGGCGRPITACIPNRSVDNRIMTLQVSCPAKFQNNNNRTKRARTTRSNKAPDIICCDWQGSLSEYIEKHKDGECMIRPVVCPSEGCSKETLQRDLEKHLASECDRRTVSCNLCNEEMCHGDLRLHKSQSCPETMTTCDYCGDRMLRKNLGTKPADYQVDDLPEGQSQESNYSGHYKVCPEMLVKCEYHESGCDELIKRKDLDTHYHEYSRKHTRLLAQQQADEINRIKNDKEWHFKDLHWEIPEDDLRAVSTVPRAVQESIGVNVGQEVAFVRLVFVSGKVLAYICVSIPCVPPCISGLEIAAVVKGTPLGILTLNDDHLMTRDSEHQNTVSTGGALKRCDNDQAATLQDLVTWCDQGKLVIRSRFKLKSTNDIVVTSSKQPSLNVHDEAFWNSHEQQP